MGASLRLYSLHLFQFVNLSLPAMSLVRRLVFRKRKEKKKAKLGWPESSAFDAVMTDAGAGHVNRDKE